MTTPGKLSLGELLAHLAAEGPGAPAVTCAGRTLTRLQLDEASNRLARLLTTRGVARGSYVSIGVPNSPDFLVAAFAVWKCGAVPQPVSARAPASEVAAVLRLARPSATIGFDGGGQTPAVSLDDAAGFDSGPLGALVSPTWKAMLSGGSSGVPKLVEAASPAIAANVLPFASLVAMPSEAVVAVPGPLHHNGPFMFSVLGVLTGNHVLLQERFEAPELLQLVRDHGASWLYQVPTMMLRIWRLQEAEPERQDLPSLQTVVHMAAPCPPWLKRAWINWLGPEKVLEIYAATEAQAATRIDGAEWLDHPGSVGRTVLGEIQVLDATGKPAAPGVVGRVWLRRGPEAPVPYRYVGSEAQSLPGGWECVGDLGYQDDNGRLYLTDRDSDMIIVGGSNVYPAEVEAAIDAHPAVLSSCVIGLPHADLGAAPHAIVQAQRALSAAELDAFLRERLSAYKLPRSVEFTSDPLRDEAGKVRRSALRAARLAPADSL